MSEKDFAVTYLMARRAKGIKGSSVDMRDADPSKPSMIKEVMARRAPAVEPQMPEDESMDLMGDMDTELDMEVPIDSKKERMRKIMGR
jgi:hypothetical protein